MDRCFVLEIEPESTTGINTHQAMGIPENPPMTPQVFMDSQDRVSYRYRVVARLSRSPLNPPWLGGL